MVEGHSVHRVAAAHRTRLVGKAFQASSPNGRFAAGAAAINGRRFSRIEAVGKNLFAFFAVAGSPDVVVHVHFGMSGRWSVADAARAKEPTATSRLRLEGHGLVAQLSAMTVDYGGPELFAEKVAKLGSDPLRADADPEKLWERVSASQKSIGSLLMDQAYFAGVGNIYRAEILFVAGIHPEVKGSSLSRAEFDRVWAASVSLMRRGFASGSILTVDPAEAVALGKPNLRRYIYNSARCGRCGGAVRSWNMHGRTCYVCAACQPLHGRAEAPKGASAPRLFTSHCAPDSLAERLKEPQKLQVAELKAILLSEGLPTSGRKAELLARLLRHLEATQHTRDGEVAGEDESKVDGEVNTGGVADSTPLTALVSAIADGSDGLIMRTAKAAAADKVVAGESRAVEHVADDEQGLSDSEGWMRVSELDAHSSASGQANSDAKQQNGELDGQTTVAKRRTVSRVSRKSKVSPDLPPGPLPSDSASNAPAEQPSARKRAARRGEEQLSTPSKRARMQNT